MALNRTVVVSLALLAALPAVMAADTLILRDGSRVRGELIEIRDGVIEFDEQRSFGRSRTLRLDRDEVARIELDEDGGRGDFRNDLRDDRRDDRRDGGPAAGMREQVIVVSGRAGWKDTGITVRAGQTIYIEASGEVRWGDGRRDGPSGERNSPENAGRPMPNRPAAALIGSVGTSGDPGSGVFFIGDDEGGLRMRSDGTLFLGVNDDYLQDNTGAFRVTVYY